MSYYGQEHNGYYTTPNYDTPSPYTHGTPSSFTNDEQPPQYWSYPEHPQQQTPYNHTPAPSFDRSHPAYHESHTYASDALPPSGTPQDTTDRGFMGALAGGAAGAYGGHKLSHHGFLGAAAGAFAGHKAEDFYKHHAQQQQEEQKHKLEQHVQQQQQQQQQQQPQTPATASLATLARRDDRDGDFILSARGVRLDDDLHLHAECRDRRGNMHHSRIALNTVLSNDNGCFAWVRDGSEAGNFGASARGVRLVEDGRVLQAELCRCDGGWCESRVILTDRISNEDGMLVLI